MPSAKEWEKIKLAKGETFQKGETMPEEKTQEQKPVNKVGYKTSEFWVTLGTLGAILGGQFVNVDMDTATQTAAVAASSVYALVRMFLKK